MKIALYNKDAVDDESDQEIEGPIPLRRAERRRPKLYISFRLTEGHYKLVAIDNSMKAHINTQIVSS